MIRKDKNETMLFKEPLLMVVRGRLKAIDDGSEVWMGVSEDGRSLRKVRS